uniref:Cadherin domain-containing protein n=1 Tax=Knipowitschia caucasica TaxID=637954 RepID=A0AAV2JRH7_KNICA
MSAKIARRRGVGGSHVVKLGDSRSADQWDSSVEASRVVTLKSLVSREQSEETVSYVKLLQSHAASSDKDKQLFKPKREVDWHMLAASKEVSQEVHCNRGNLDDSAGSDSRSKHLVSSAQIEVKSLKKGVMIDQTEPPFTSTKHLPQFVPSETNAPSVLTMQPQGPRPGNRAADSHRDPLAESLHFAELNTAQYPEDEDGKLVNSSGSSHVLRLHPSTPNNRNSKEAKTAESQIQENGAGLVFEELEEEEGILAGASEGKAARSRSRRSWIWNQFFVIEEYAGPEPVLIGRLHTDMDRNDGRTKYVLRGEGAGSVFVIDEKTGNIHVTKPLDREEKDEYRLIATATDRQTERPLEPSSQFIIRVQDINDNPPLFDQGPYIATVPEMENIGTSIIQVTATDADDPTYGNSAKLVYTLVQGQQFFSVDPQTGILRTAVPDMDRERQDTYLVILQAKDMGGHLGGLSGTTTVTVKLTDVNDSPPRFTQSTGNFDPNSSQGLISRWLIQ